MPPRRAFGRPSDPCTSIGTLMNTTNAPELLRVEGLQTWYPIRSTVLRRTVGQVRAVDGVSFSIRAGETLGLVGESGCGKSTTGRSIIRLTEPTGGKVFFDGVDVASMSRGDLRQVRQDMQFVFQDPFSSLNPRLRIRDIVAEPLHRGPKSMRRRRVEELLELTGLNVDYADRYPHQLSGVSGSGSALPAHCRRIRSCSSSTSRCRPSTYPSRRRSSTC